MSANKLIPRDKEGAGNRRGMLQPVEQHTTGAGEEEIDWKKVVMMIGAMMARGLHSSDQAVLMAHQLKFHCGVEVAQVFAEGFCCNRDKSIHNFMG